MSDLELLDPAQLAERLRVSPNTIGNWRSSGKITPAIAEGRVVRYVLADVLADVLAEMKPKKKARK